MTDTNHFSFEKIAKLIIFLYFYDMNKRKERGLDFEIDKLTNSIENILKGEVFLY